MTGKLALQLGGKLNAINQYLMMKKTSTNNARILFNYNQRDKWE